MSNASIGGGGGDGDVTAASNIADNAVVRGDGGAKGIQGSGVTLDDSDNVTGVAALTVTGLTTSATATVTGALSAASATLTAPLPLASGGTAAATATAAFDGLSPTTTKGDLIASDGTNNVRLAAGTNDQVLTADSTEDAGVKWADAGGGARIYPGINLNASPHYSFIAPTLSIGTLNLTNDLLYLLPIQIANVVTWTVIGVDVTSAVAGSTIRLGLYSMNSTNGLFSLVTDYGTLSSAATGVVTIAATDTMTTDTSNFLALIPDENAGSVALRANTLPFFCGYNDGGTGFKSFTKAGEDAGSSYPATYALADLTLSSAAIPLGMYRT